MPSCDRSPAFPFYVKDWLSDPRVTVMPYSVKGRYVDILCWMWAYSDEGCQIPVKMAVRLVGRTAVDYLVDNGILVRFSSEDEELLFSNRLSAEAQKHTSRKEQAARAGKRSQAVQKAMRTAVERPLN
ncbi:MAG: hypothetical protein U1E29_18375 [Coriobacteriia bacterium]|nr:hypothetical protein [Coriobacteriia bacterium]